MFALSRDAIRVALRERALDTATAALTLYTGRRDARKRFARALTKVIQNDIEDD